MPKQYFLAVEKDFLKRCSMAFLLAIRSSILPLICSTVPITLLTVMKFLFKLAARLAYKAGLPAGPTLPLPLEPIDELLRFTVPESLVGDILW